jgi:hypothetical protein
LNNFGRKGKKMLMNVLMLIGVMLLGGVLVLAAVAMVIAAIDFLQNGD